MIKQDIIRKLVSTTSLTTSEATIAVENTLDILANAFKRGENIELRNFGTFKMIERKAKKAQDMGRRITISLPARRTVKFEPSKTLKEAIN
jgi:nucleoid DNA-binding protein